MRLSIQRLRWVLIAGALLLTIVLAAFIGYGRYQAIKAYRQILSRSGVTLTHDSNGVTYSQSLRGRKIFTVRAKTESSLGDRKWALHDAEMLIYNRSGDHPDHIYGSEIEYDEDAGIARAKGEVFMDLQPPQGLADGGHATTQPEQGGGFTPGNSASTKSKSGPAPIIHVRTSGLVYLRKLGIAATDQQVEFSYGGMQCTALGAEFNSGQSTLHLLANVHMDGLAHGRPLQVTATRADLERDANLAQFTHPIVTSDGRKATSNTAVLHLRKDGSVERLEGVDHVVLSSGTRQITANRLDATLDQQSIPQAARLSGTVTLLDADPVRPMHGSASFLDVAFNAKGTPASTIARGSAKLFLIDHQSNPRGLARSMDAEKIVALFTAARNGSLSRISEVQATGSAHAAEQSVIVPIRGARLDTNQALPIKNTQIWADDLRVLFRDTEEGNAKPQKVFGTGHTIFQQDAPEGEQETSSGDNLEISFAAESNPSPTVEADQNTMHIASALQTGHVTMRDRAASKAGSSEPGSSSTATADRAMYNGPSQSLTLTGNAHLYGDNSFVMAPVISLDQRTQDVEANGGVQVSFANAPFGSEQRFADTAASPDSRPVPVTHILSSGAHFEHAAKLATFYGTDSQPARMWQDASQVQAATLLFDGVERTFSARPAKRGGLIHAIFASNSTESKPRLSARASSILRVASPKMDYNDVRREATFSDGVTIDDSTGQVSGQHAVVLLLAATESPSVTQKADTIHGQPNPFSGSIDRVIVYGSVKIDEPGRLGTGEQLIFTAATASYILTGTSSTPPQIVDARQGNVTGATLLFSNSGSTIVVAGDPNAPKGKGGRVRSETHVNPGKDERR